MRNIERITGHHMNTISKVLEGLADHQWSWDEFFYCRIKSFN